MAELKNSHTRQVLGAPTSVQQLRSPRNRQNVRRHILQNWLEHGRMKIVVAVTRKKEFANWLRQSDLPDNILIEDLDVDPASHKLVEILKRYEADLSVWSVIVL